ncbi:hypothetical protein PMAYCL1PPCAC_21054, partial [Pristionchus mayeri]
VMGTVDVISEDWSITTESPEFMSSGLLLRGDELTPTGIDSDSRNDACLFNREFLPIPGMKDC